ncbi:MAG: zinc-binding dehydrogenase [Chloroflexi bacterium]|nr:zinc-binding dehydrogenase [Chloroflexota bacterium]
MKGVMKFAAGDGNIEVRDVDEPTPPPAHVKIAVELAGVCGTDIHIYHDEFKSWPPVILGHEVVGTVAEVGDGVDRVKPGTRVTTETYFRTCGKCRFCRSGLVNLCPERRSIGSAVNGGFTSFVIVPEKNIHTLPDNVTFNAGVMTEPLACVVHGALELPRLTPGDVAVVAGPGAIGLLTMQAVKAAGATVVVLGTDVDEARLQTAKELGADYTFNVQRDNFKSAVKALTNGYGADIVYECSGAGPAAQMLLDLARRAGQYAQVGLFGKPVTWDLEQVCYKELSVTGSNASVPSAWDRAIDLIASGLVKTEPLLTGVYPITEWFDAFRVFETRQGLKTALKPVD